MRRGGRILLFLVLIIVILIAVAFLVIGGGGLFPTQEATPTPPWVSIVVAGQPINRDDEIKADALSTMQIPQDRLTEKMVTNQDQVIGKFAVYPLAQGLPLTTDMIADRPGLNQPGSEAAKVVSPGLVAISIPINRLNSVAYGIRDGDRVNIIATTMFVDVDSNFQSLLPNNFGQVVGTGIKPDEAPLVTLGMNNQEGTRPAGRAELDPVLNQAIYYTPSELQRPRLVSQLILQDIQVLHVGDFALPGSQTVTEAPAAGAPTGAEAPTPVPVVKPDIITLIVTPQDAIALTYLMYNGTKFTLTLRAPDDTTRVETEAATLQYILSQYAIPVPAKLPYSVQPRVDELKDPVLNNDSIPTPAP